MLQARERTLIPSSIVCTFEFAFEFFKEFGGTLDAMDYCFKITFNYNFKLVWGKMCCKGITKLKA
jgi:hypothetical protein